MRRVTQIKEKLPCGQGHPMSRPRAPDLASLHAPPARVSVPLLGTTAKKVRNGEIMIIAPDVFGKVVFAVFVSQMQQKQHLAFSERKKFPKSSFQLSFYQMKILMP